MQHTYFGNARIYVYYSTFYEIKILFIHILFLCRVKLKGFGGEEKRKAWPHRGRRLSRCPETKAFELFIFFVHFGHRGDNLKNWTLENDVHLKDIIVWIFTAKTCSTAEQEHAGEKGLTSPACAQTGLVRMG